MSRRTHSCRSCSGRTRHGDRRCSRCRRRPRSRLIYVPTIAGPNAPTAAELNAGFDISTYLEA